MNKKFKFLLIAVFLLIILAIITFIGYYFIKSTFYTTTGIIVAKNSEKILIKDSIDTTQLSYELDINKNKPKFKDINGKKVDLSNIHIGDKIKITYTKEKMQNAVYYIPPKIENCKIIQVIDDNSNKHISGEDLIYYFIETTLAAENYTKNIFSFDIHGNIYDFVPDGCTIKIIKKGNNVNENTEVKYFDSSLISFSKVIDFQYKLVINVNSKNLVNELDIGKYILRIEDKNGKIIKVPFENNQNRNLQC